MSRLSDTAAALGYGRDRTGDDARRAALTHAYTADQATIHRLASQAVRRELRARADRTVEDAKAMTPNGPPAAPAEPGHRLTERRTGAGIEVTCECGQFDGWYNGPRSRRFLLADHARHVADWTMHVTSERADDPSTLPPGGQP